MLDQLHEKIIDNIKNNIVGLQVCDAYPKIKKGIPLPAVLIDLEEFPSVEENSEQQAFFTAVFIALCIVDSNNSDNEKLHYEMDSRILAVSVAQQVIKGGNLNLPAVSQPRRVHCYEDVMKPELDGYNTWAVQWEQDFILGESVFDYSDCETPTILNIGFVPDVGIGHEQDYIRVK